MHNTYKSFSQRVKNKNFKLIGKKPLFKIIIDKIIKAKCFDKIIIDSDSDIIKKFVLRKYKVYGAASFTKKSKNKWE